MVLEKDEKTKVSIIIPVYNEEKHISACLDNVLRQHYPDFETIVVDDGSTDRSIDIIRRYPVRLIQQKHRGAGAARNLGVKHSRGEILVFIDSDQILDEHFVEKLVGPILRGEVIGTHPDDEHIANIDNLWSKCWNISHGLPPVAHISRRTFEEKETYVFRALLKNEFLKVNGFEENIGYSDDQIGKKLGVKSTSVKGAIAYHKNPSSLSDVYTQAVWMGKGISRENPLINLIARLPPIPLFRAIPRAIKYKIFSYIIFKVVFDFGLMVGILKGMTLKDYSR